MKDTELVVYREYFGRFEEVGRVVPAGGGIGFAYSESYLQSRTAQSISQALPLRPGAFSARETESFFNGILPEGSMRRSLGRAFHADIDDVGAFMARLNDESAGALVFGKGEEPLLEGRSYAPVGEEDLVRFAARPGEFAPRAASRSRLSLAGAQMKIGLFFDTSSGFWFYPQGAAPSSHIVKACDGSFPDQTVNEAICMRTAAALGFDVAPCHLIPVAGQEPLLAVERFDRIDDVRMEDIVATARSCGVGARFARDELEELIEVFPSVLREAAGAVAEEGFPRAAEVGRRIEEGFLGRRDALR